MLSLQIMGLVSLLKARGAEGPGHTRSNVTLSEMERSPVVNFETFPIVLPYRGVADWLQVLTITVYHKQEWRMQQLVSDIEVLTFKICESPDLIPNAYNDAMIYCCFIVLLEAITKNGSTAGGGAYCRKPASSNDQSKPSSTKEGNASAAGESGKGYTKDQMEGVFRYGLA